MSFYDREWYREYRREKETGKRKSSGKENRYQAFWDAAWEEIEPSRRKKKNTSANTVSKDTPQRKQKPDLDEYILIPGGCTRCCNSIPIRIKRKNASHFSYICPKCGQKMSVTSTRKLSKIDKALTYGLYICGAIAFCLIAYSLLSPLLLKII